jgi:hypothetical protein
MNRQAESLAHDRADEAGLVQVHVDGVSLTLEQPAVGVERFRDACFRSVEIVEIATVARRVRLDQDRGPAREVRIEGPVPGKQPGEARLVVGQRHSFLEISQASRPPCLRSCSATQATSGSPMS